MMGKLPNAAEGDLEGSPNATGCQVEALNGNLICLLSIASTTQKAIWLLLIGWVANPLFGARSPLSQTGEHHP